MFHYAITQQTAKDVFHAAFLCISSPLVVFCRLLLAYAFSETTTEGPSVAVFGSLSPYLLPFG